MTRSLRKCAVFSATAVLLAVLVGMCAGYLLGLAISYENIRKRLIGQSELIRNIIETYSYESRSTLSWMNSTAYVDCSDEEIEVLRNVVFRSRYLTDAGHIHNNQIDCSAVMGRLKHPIPTPPPLFYQKDGTAMHANLAPKDNPDRTSIGTQLGDAYVVTSEYLLSDLGPAPLHYTTTVPDVRTGKVGRLRGESPDIDRNLLMSNGFLHYQGALYANRCSERFFTCITSFVSLNEAYHDATGFLLQLSLFGGCAGLVVGILLAALFNVSRAASTQFRRAVASGRFEMAYQPILDLKDQKIVAAEALLRWRDDDGFYVNPEYLVRQAEQRGYMRDLTQAIIRKALHDFAGILHERPAMRLSINVAPSDLLDAEFLPYFLRLLLEHKLTPHSILLEITESTSVDSVEIHQSLERLHRAGFTILIDDFGAGYSSLSYLQSLSIDGVKIDKSFIRPLGLELASINILPQILDMMTLLGLRVIIEGIETEEQRAYFDEFEREILAQGWLFSKAVSIDAFQALLPECSPDSAS